MKTLRKKLEEEGRWNEVNNIGKDLMTNMNKTTDVKPQTQNNISNNNANTNNTWNNILNRVNTILNDTKKAVSNFGLGVSSSAKNALYYIQNASEQNNSNYKYYNQIQAKFKHEKESHENVLKQNGEDTSGLVQGLILNENGKLVPAHKYESIILTDIDKNLKKVNPSDLETNLWDKIKLKANSLINKISYQAQSLGTGFVNGVTGMLQSPMTEMANQLNKGEKKKTSEAILDTIESIVSPQTSIIKNSIDLSNEIKAIQNNDNLNTGEKITQGILKSISTAKNSAIPGKDIFNNVMQTVGSIIPNADEEVLKSTKEISKPADKLNQLLEDESKDHNKVENFISDAMQSVGNMGASISTSIATGNPTVGLLAMGESVKGQSTMQALQQGKSLQEAVEIGDTKGLIEIGTEMLTGGINFFGKGALDDILDSGLKNITNEVNRFLATQFKNSVGEIGEELISDILNTFIDKYTVDSDVKYGIKDIGKTAGSTILTTFLLNLFTGGLYNDIQLGKNRSNLKIETNNSNLSDIEKQNIVKKINEGEITNQEQLKNILPTQNQQMTIDNEQVLNNNQQVILEDSKIAQNQTSQQISNIEENNQKNNYNSTENLQNYQNSAQKYNIDLNNDTVKAIFGTADRRGIKINYDDSIFSNSNQNAIWKLNEDGSREIIINPNADSQKTLQSIQVHELTHDMEGTEEYKKLSDAVLNKMKTQEEYQEAFNDLKDMYSKVYDINSKNFNSLVEQEAVADFLGENLGNQEFLNELVKSQPRSTIQKIYDWIVDKINKLTGYNTEKLYWQDVKTKFENAFNSDFNNQNNKSNKFSIQTDSNGNKYVKVDIDQDIFKNKNLKEQKDIAKKYILDNFREKGLIKDNTNINVSRKTANEYTNPKNKLPNSTLSNKLKASTELDNLLSISKYVKSSKDDGRHVFAKNGWDYYETTFQVGNKVYTGLLNIAKGERGKLLYDITQIKESSNNISVKTESVVRTSSNNSIPNSNTNVNNENTTTKYSMQENENNTGKWQEFLQKHSVNKGTRNTIQDVKLPENNLQNENNINSTAKAQNYEKRQNSKFKRQMSEFLGVSRFSKNNKTILDNAITQLRNEYNSKGKISENTRNIIFKDMYNNLVKEDSNYYNEYKDLKNEIESTEINISTQIKKDITDYRDFTREFGNNINISKDNSGIEVDSYYKELSSKYSELFSDKITNPADQLRIIAEVSKSISKSENNISAYADKYLGKEYESWARRQFNQLTDNLIKEYEVIDDYNQDRSNQNKKDDYIRPKEDEIRWIYENRAQLQKEYEKVNNNTLLTRKEKAIVDRLLKDEMSFEEIMPGFNKEAIAKVYSAKQQLEYVNNEIKKYKQDVKNNLKEFAENLVENSEKWKDKKARYSLCKRNSTKKYTRHNG